MLSYKSNVVGNIHLFNLFLPLILKGTHKKVIFISSGHADLDLITGTDMKIQSTYAMHKAAMNIAVAKFAAEYGPSDEVLFISISPGVVDTGNYDHSKSKFSEAAFIRRVEADRVA
jgi:NAD(P)-dependent dehydrogenase (short-subunit alcohol dehydrogenase family)